LIALAAAAPGYAAGHANIEREAAAFEADAFTNDLPPAGRPAAPSRCDPGATEGNEQCARWAAVAAARDSARIARLSFYAIIAAVAGLILTLLMTARAARAASRASAATEQAVALAERTAKQQLRAYVSFAGFSLVIRNDCDGKAREGEFAAEWLNGGQTPAAGVDDTINWRVFDGELPEDFRFPPSERQDAFGALTLGPGRGFTSTSTRLDLDALRALTRADKLAYVWAAVDYVDTFGEARRTEAAALVCVSAAEGGEFAVAFHAIRRHNGMDGRCERPPIPIFESGY
jgi:type II secretory pathway pseudopilin PulG